MSAITHQTIKLKRGKHSTPAEGACVMELASMLAGEPFTDHPVCVSPVISSFLRAYNDFVDDDRRQDLYEYASRVVGSRRSEELEEARAERLRVWMLARRRRGWRRFVLPQHFLSLQGMAGMELLGPRAVHAISRSNADTHAEALALVDELLLIGAAERDHQTSRPDARQFDLCQA